MGRASAVSSADGFPARPPTLSPPTGLYLPKVPRLVPMIFLSAGNRAEAFMRCNKPGDYFVAAGHDPSPFVIDPTDTSMDDPTTGALLGQRLRAVHRGAVAEAAMNGLGAAAN